MRFVTLVVFIFAVFISSCAPIPTKNEPAAYTKAVVQDAIRFYKQEGIQATIDHFSSPSQIDGQWYVAIADAESGQTIAHPDYTRIGAQMAELVDTTGNMFGHEILSADENGKWVQFFWDNPLTGKVHRKHLWVVLYDDLLFGSGWYEDEEFVRVE